MSERDELIARLRILDADDRRLPFHDMRLAAADLLERDGAEIARLQQWQRDMVAKAADRSLAGYRELAARVAAAENERDSARAALADVSAAIGTNEFMDPPDGGSPSLAEQVRRMRAALAERAANARLTEELDAARAEIERLRAACVNAGDCGCGMRDDGTGTEDWGTGTR